MEDFNEFSKNRKNNKYDESNILNLISSVAKKYDGKDQNELLKAIYSEAEKGKRAGTLTNKDLDNFAFTLSPFLDDKKKKILDKLLTELKKI